MRGGMRRRLGRTSGTRTKEGSWCHGMTNGKGGRMRASGNTSARTPDSWEVLYIDLLGFRVTACCMDFSM